MATIQLSKRLAAVAAFVPAGAKVADIGSDHAYLPCYLVLEQVIEQAVAGEVVDGPLAAAKKQVEGFGLEGKIAVRKGSGLAVIELGEVDVITICGMGGALIRDILEEGKEKLVGVKRLILQPNIAAHNIRKWLVANNWVLQKEIILKEDDKIYEILVAEPGTPTMWTKAEMFLGPFLLKEKSSVFVEKWTKEWEILEKIKGKIEASDNAKANATRLTEITEKMTMIQEALQ